ncbi:MAG: hypothetical protein DCF25_18305 [Leptolyngbya foveolarum]|uniref:Methyltransferase type 11 domain-containing protein n=1 Tax=Leptolyngbya foveolarum TaxID=47253 RepID=A0A2W4VYZ9_9CYAN|nr:MAG: hypothetical protein DCF25_18305 [Leptolyngbya foveolarum]
MRANPQQLREEFRSHLTSEEIGSLGVDLGAGSNHYRAYVGPPFNYDINGALQFQFMLDLGLREYHRFLEIGCGSLRLGRLLMMYLLPSRYYGVEPNEEMFHEGVRNNLGASLEDSDFIRLKKPTFSYNDAFDFSLVEGTVDFVIAQSIASHTGVEETKKLMTSVSSVMHENSIAMITYIRCVAESKSNKENGWFYPECISYTDSHMSKEAKALGLIAYKTSWPLLNKRTDGLITTQTPLILTRKPWKATLAQQFSGLNIDAIEQLV